MAPAVIDVFVALDTAVANGVPLRPGGAGGLSNPFQNWFYDTLRHAGIESTPTGSNAWPDFTLDDIEEGYELKGLIVPGRDRDFDANSRLPKGAYDGRTVYYVFGRYAKDAVAESKGLSDLVVCHGDFLSQEGQPVQANTNVKGAGTYGDIMIRVRKMFVPPTPFRSVEGTIGQRTLILPDSMTKEVEDAGRLVQVGTLDRMEATDIIRKVVMDLNRPGLIVEKQQNPTGGTLHKFIAWRTPAANGPSVKMAVAPEPITVQDVPDENSDA